MEEKQPGTIVGGKYRLDEEIGRGGAATVWRGTHTTLMRPVAIKFIHPADDDADRAAERFLTEARLVASVRHRMITDTLDFGTTEDGEPFMVMELLEGLPFHERLESTPALSDAEVIRLARLVLSGLAAVHETGIVHRDLKPENIFVVEDADGRFPKLLDFGISKHVGLQKDPSSRTTQEGLLVGTPHYMSPEQARGLPDIDRRTDIYSMGVILYEALTGCLPYDADHVGDLLIGIAQGGAPPVKRFRPELGSAISDVVEHAMGIERDQRHDDARTMSRALEGAVRDLPADTYGPLTPAHDAGAGGKTRPGPVGSTQPGAVRAASPASDSREDTAASRAPSGHADAPERARRPIPVREAETRDEWSAPGVGAGGEAAVVGSRANRWTAGAQRLFATLRTRIRTAHTRRRWGVAAATLLLLGMVGGAGAVLTSREGPSSAGSEPRRAGELASGTPRPRGSDHPPEWTPGSAGDAPEEAAPLDAGTTRTAPITPPHGAAHDGSPDADAGDSRDAGHADAQEAGAPVGGHRMSPRRPRPRRPRRRPQRHHERTSGPESDDLLLRDPGY